MIVIEIGIGILLALAILQGVVWMVVGLWNGGYRAAQIERRLQWRARP